MENNTNFFGGFSAITDALTNRTVSHVAQVGTEDPEGDHIVDVDPSELEDQDDVNTQKGGKTNKIKDEFIDADVDTNDDSDTDSSDDEEVEEREEEGGITELSEAEPEIAQFVQEELAKALNIEFEDDQKFKSIKEVVEYLEELVEASSKPEFADEEIEKINKFVSDGGTVAAYLKTAHGEVDLDEVDLSVEGNQKAVIRELLKEKGYSEARIKKSIERYEDAGVLEDEAEDAKELLAEIREKKTEKLLQDKEKEKQELLAQQQKYIHSVEESVNTLNSVRGIPISDKEKKQLLDYIFKPTADGRTRYQKDYMSSVNNLIESAYFTMKGDTFVQKIERKANSEAAINLKKKLANRGKDTSKNQKESGSSWGLLSSQLRKLK
jgi:hypothetical protein